MRLLRVDIYNMLDVTCMRTCIITCTHANDILCEMQSLLKTPYS